MDTFTKVFVAVNHPQNPWNQSKVGEACAIYTDQKRALDHASSMVPDGRDATISIDGDNTSFRIDAEDFRPNNGTLCTEVQKAFLTGIDAKPITTFLWVLLGLDGQGCAEVQEATHDFDKICQTAFELNGDPATASLVMVKPHEWETCAVKYEVREKSGDLIGILTKHFWNNYKTQGEKVTLEKEPGKCGVCGIKQAMKSSEECRTVDGKKYGGNQHFWVTFNGTVGFTAEADQKQVCKSCWLSELQKALDYWKTQPE